MSPNVQDCTGLFGNVYLNLTVPPESIKKQKNKFLEI